MVKSSALGSQNPLSLSLCLAEKFKVAIDLPLNYGGSSIKGIKPSGNPSSNLVRKCTDNVCIRAFEWSVVQNRKEGWQPEPKILLFVWREGCSLSGLIWVNKRTCKGWLASAFIFVLESLVNGVGRNHLMQRHFYNYSYWTQNQWLLNVWLPQTFL